MATIIHDARGQVGVLGYHAYCCMDSMVARECFDILYPRLSPADRMELGAAMQGELSRIIRTWTAPMRRFPAIG